VLSHDQVLIADDHAIVRAGCCAGAGTGLNWLGGGRLRGARAGREKPPDILVLDLSMTDLDGISVTRRLKQKYPNLRILILTLHEDEALLREAIKAGAAGYILKKAAETELLSAIQVVQRGDLYVDPAMLRTLLGEIPQPQQPHATSTETLTSREAEVLNLIVEGYTNRQIGEHLSISVRTVEGHRANISDKLGLHSRLELVRYAREHGMIE
jgi:two-component system response regulator NreC